MKDLGHLSVSEQAYCRIKEMIIRGQLAQGQVLSVLYLVDLLGLGRTPVTTACQKLQVDGFLRIIPKQGVLIEPITVTDAQELYEAREAIELYMAGKAFENISDADIKELEASMSRQVALSEKGDAYGFMEEDTYFHRYIMGKYQNNILMKMHLNMTDRIFLLGVKNVSNPKRLQESIENHRRQIACLKAKDKQGFLAEVVANQISGYVFASSISGL